MGYRGSLFDSPVREVGNQYPVAWNSPVAQGSFEPGKHCAYNQTQGRFLGSDVDAGDFAGASFDGRMQTLTADSGAGLWLVPFRGISPTSVRIPLDLIYLDRNNAVIDVVESFPLARVSPASPTAASVLVLPADTIQSTQTHPGDQLLLCAPGEMKRRLQQLPGPGGNAEAVQAAAPGRIESTRSGPARVLQMEDRFRQKRANDDLAVPELPFPELPNAQPPNEVAPPAELPQGKTVVEPAQPIAKPKKGWLQRWLSPEPTEPRKAPRESLAGLTAFFWTGGAPVRQGIRDISETGLFVVTEERWYPGTVVRMTLTDCAEPVPERSICVYATVIRWGNDGVGLQFVLKQTGNARSNDPQQVEGIDKRHLAQFMQLLGSANRQIGSSNR